MLDNLAFNERRQKDSIKLFEISDVYTRNNTEILKTRRLAVIGSGRVGHNYEDFSKKITKKYLTNLFYEAFPSEDLDFQLLSRDALNSKSTNDIFGLEVDIDSFSSQVLNYKERLLNHLIISINTLLYLTYHILKETYHFQLKISLNASPYKNAYLTIKMIFSKKSLYLIIFTMKKI